MEFKKESKYQRTERFNENAELFDNYERSEYRPWNMDHDQFCMLMHLSQFAGFVVPFAGFALPIAMWATNKDESPEIDQHGKNIMNWMISSIIYLIAATILIIVLIGIPIILAIVVCSLVFTIIGAVRASEGKIYKYPMSIEFIK